MLLASHLINSPGAELPHFSMRVDDTSNHPGSWSRSGIRRSGSTACRLTPDERPRWGRSSAVSTSWPLRSVASRRKCYRIDDTTGTQWFIARRLSTNRSPTSLATLTLRCTGGWTATVVGSPRRPQHRRRRREDDHGGGRASQADAHGNRRHRHRRRWLRLAAVLERVMPITQNLTFSTFTYLVGGWPVKRDWTVRARRNARIRTMVSSQVGSLR